MSEDHIQNTGGVPSGENPNDGSAGGIGVGEPDGRHPAPPTPNWSEFVEGLNKLNDSLGNKLDGIRNTVTETTRPPPPEPPNYDTMSNAELVAHVTGSLHGTIQETIQSALKPLMEQVSGMQSDLVRTNGSIELKELRASHKDFGDWKDEMIGLAKQHASLGFRDVYLLARANNPEKARQLDLKYNPPVPKPKPFGGLTSSGNGRAGEPPLRGEEATKAAYREVMERHQGILPALQDL